MKRFQGTIIKAVFLIISLGMGLTLWWLLTTYSQIPSFIFPKPDEVWDRLLIVLKDGTLFYHTLITLQEVIVGLALGLSAAIITGYFLAKSRIVEQVLSPYIVASQSIPIVAIAP